MQPAFRGRKHNTTQNVLAAVDFDLRFTYVLAGWEGSAHDALILSMLLKELMALECHQVQYKPDNVIANAYPLMKLLKDVILSKFLGKFYLVDAGYAVRPGFLPPYHATRYHLRKFGANRPQNKKRAV
jgi:hypothetical protein